MGGTTPSCLLNRPFTVFLTCEIMGGARQVPKIARVMKLMPGLFTTYELLTMIQIFIFDFHSKPFLRAPRHLSDELISDRHISGILILLNLTFV